MKHNPTRRQRLLPHLSLLLILALGTGMNEMLLAQSAAQLPLGQLLNADGTLNRNSRRRGSVEVSGWQMTTGPKGEPRFVPAEKTASIKTPNHLMSVPDDVNWDDRFFLNGVSGSVDALAVDGSGNVYVGGNFTTASNIVAYNIAKWDGTNWSPLGSGTGSEVQALAVDGSGNVYAGGNFTTAGNVIVNGIAKWNGSSWSALSSGVNGGDIRALAVDGSGNVYAGGFFTTAGGVSANRIAKWNGSSWSALGIGIGGIVEALAIDSNDNLYAGGTFTTAGSMSANNIAKWNGSSWSALSSGTDSFVKALTVDSDDNVYAGGFFTTAGGVSANFIAKWNGSSWSALGSGMSGGFATSVYALAVDGSDNVYAGGDFTTTDGVSTNNIVKWNGSSWSALNSGLNNDARALAVDGIGNVYAGGFFNTAGAISANSIAKWDGSSWFKLGADGSGLYGTVYALVADGNGNVYAGGFFIRAGSVSANHIAKWDGNTWSALGSGMDNTVYALAIDGNGNVYAGGNFTMAGGMSANNIAKWNGSTWSAMSSGMNDEVRALTIDSNGNVYAGGRFTIAGGVSANYIAKWDGGNWSALSNGVSGGAPFTYIFALTVDGNGNVYAGGKFMIAGGVSANNIAKWDGSSWSALGSGVDDEVDALAFDGNVYAGGLFTRAGSVSAEQIAKWDGSNWSALGSGVNNDGVRVLAVDGSGTLYAGGDFTNAGGLDAIYIARWNGSNWSALGSGVSSEVKALTVDDRGNVYTGGQFTIAGNKVSLHFARYQEPRSRVFLAEDLIRINQNVQSEGTIRCNGRVIFGAGAPGAHTGRIRAVGDIDIGTQNTITADDVSSGGQVTLNGTATVIGTVNSNAGIGRVALPVLSYAAGGASYTVPKGGSLSLAPGSYGTVRVRGHATLHLSAGDYFFQRLETLPLANLSLNVSAGAVNVNVVDALNFAESVRVNVVGGLTSQVTFSTMQSSDLNIDRDAILRGTVNAPSAQVNFATGSAFKGELSAREIILAPRVKFLSHRSTLPFPKVSEAEEAEVSDQTSVASYQLEQNYPNPFNPSTIISFQLPVEGEVSLAIYNLNGQLVKQLAGGNYGGGRHQILWDATDARGGRVASGVYLYVLKAGDFVAKKKLVVMK